MKMVSIEIPEVLLEAVQPLLEQARQDLSNNGCNDYSLPDTPEMRKLVEIAFLSGTGDELGPPQVYRGKLLTQDTFILDYLHTFLKKPTKEDKCPQ